MEKNYVNNRNLKKIVEIYTGREIIELNKLPVIIKLYNGKLFRLISTKNGGLILNKK